MNHLSPAEFVDAADGALTASRAAHLERCAECAAQVSALRETVGKTRAIEVPEPSPLYWPQLAKRVRESVAGESIAPSWRATPWREYFDVRALVPVASALAVVAAVVVTGLMTRPAPVGIPEPSAPAIRGAAVDPGLAPENSEVWQILTSAAADVPFEDAHAAGLGVGAGAVDSAVQRMTPEELTELSRLLQTELRRAGD